MPNIIDPGAGLHPKERARARERASGKRKSRSSPSGFKYLTKTPEGFRALLADLANEVRQCDEREAKASQAAVFAALDKGRKLRLAHKMLVRWKTRAKKKRWEELPPTWDEWLKANFAGCRRTAEFYIDLSKHEKRKEVQAVLKAPDVSLRKVIQVIRSLRLDEDKEGGGEPSGIPNGQGGAEQEIPELKCHLMELRRVFAEIIKGWDEVSVRYLVMVDQAELEKRLATLEAEVRELAPLLLEAEDKHWDWKVRRDREPPRGSALWKRWKARAGKRAKKRAAIRKERGALLTKVLKKFRGRDDLTAWQREKIAELIAELVEGFSGRGDLNDWQRENIAELVEPWFEGLSPDLQLKLAPFTRNGETKRHGRVNGRHAG